MDPASFVWGAAIGVIGTFATGFLKKAGEDCYSWVRKRIYPQANEQHSSHLIIHMNNDSAPAKSQSISIADVQHSQVERVSTVTLDDINTAILNAPPLQRDHVAKSYVGLRVEWETLFTGGTLQDDGDIRIQLSVPGNKLGLPSVWCEVPASEYRELGILPERSKIRVYGEISELADYGVNLTNARLHIYDMHPTE